MRSYTQIIKDMTPVIPFFVTNMLPGGYKDGKYYIIKKHNIPIFRNGSFKIDLSNGTWVEINTGSQGDFIDLYAYLVGLDKSIASLILSKGIDLIDEMSIADYQSRKKAKNTPANNNKKEGV